MRGNLNTTEVSEDSSELELAIEVRSDYGRELGDEVCHHSDIFIISREVKDVRVDGLFGWKDGRGGWIALERRALREEAASYRVEERNNGVVDPVGIGSVICSTCDVGAEELGDVIMSGSKGEHMMCHPAADYSIGVVI